MTYCHIVLLSYCITPIMFLVLQTLSNEKNPSCSWVHVISVLSILVIMSWKNTRIKNAINRNRCILQQSFEPQIHPVQPYHQSDLRLLLQYIFSFDFVCAIIF